MYAPLSLCEAEALFVFAGGTGGAFRRMVPPKAPFWLFRLFEEIPRRKRGLLCPRRQSNQNAAGVPPDPVLPNRTLTSENCAATEAAFFASDLWRVSCPASPDGLLKGQANLGFYVDLVASVEAPQTLANQKRNTHQPEGRQAKCVTHRTDYEGAGGSAEIQWQPGIKFIPDQLDKQRGSGVSPAPCGDFCAYKSHPGSGAGSPGRWRAAARSFGESLRRRQAGRELKSKKSRRKIPHSVQNKK